MMKIDNGAWLAATQAVMADGSIKAAQQQDDVDLESPEAIALARHYCEPLATPAQDARELPPLPSMAGDIDANGESVSFYTADQMHEYARAALAQQDNGDAVDAARFRGVREMNCVHNRTSPAEFNADIDMVLAEFYARQQSDSKEA